MNFNHKWISILLYCTLLGCTQLTKINERLTGKNKSSDEQKSQRSEDKGIFDELDDQIAPLTLIDKLTIDPATCEAQESSPSSIRTPTQDEFQRSLSSILEIDLDTLSLEEILPTDSIIKGFDKIHEYNQISLSRLQLYFKAAEETSRYLLEQRPELFNCGQQARVCAEQWLRSSLRDLWRRPIDDSEYNEILALFEEQGSTEEAFGLIVTRSILSPYFLGIREIGSGGQLNKYELLSSLSFALWGQAPNSDLYNYINDRELSQKDEIKLLVQMMMKDSKFNVGLERFLNSWLELDKIKSSNNSEETIAGYTNSIKESLKDDIISTFRFLIDENGDGVKHLYNLDFMMTSPEVARFYGLSIDERSMEREGRSAYKLPDDRRGVLGLPGVIAGRSSNDHSNIPGRGNFILGRFLCSALPEPSAEILEQTSVLLPDTNISARDSLAKQTSGPACITCHRSINGIGFGIENYDPVGRTRELDDHQKTVNAQSEFFGIDGDVIAYNGAAELSEILSRSERAHQCLATQVFRYTVGRFESPSDRCTIAKVRSESYAEGMKLSDLFVQFYTNSVYLIRK